MIDVSVIIPVYNAREYIEECINSVVSQEDVEKEIICIYDDLSENSLGIIKQYALSYPWISLYQQPDKGPSSARNYGIIKAKGKYVCFLDADDFYVDKCALYKMVNAADKQKVKVCFGLRQVLNSFTNEIEKTADFRDRFHGDEESVIVDFIEYQNDFHFHSYLYEREMLLYNGLRFPVEFPLWEDPLFLLNVLLVAKKVCICHVEFYCYRYLNHIPNYGKRIEYVLKGILNNMCLARKNNLELLQHRLIERLNNDYYDILRVNFNRDVFRILLEIEDNRIISDEINYLDEICLNKGVVESVFLNRYIHIMQRGIKIEDELIRLGLKNIVLYGCGNYGHIFYRSLNGEKVKVVAVVDSKREGVFEDIEIRKKVPETLKFDGVIVTPLFSDEIVKSLKCTRKWRILPFVDLVNDLFLKIRKEDKEMSV